MKRALWILGGLVVIACLTWAFWPGDEAAPVTIATRASTDEEKPARSIAEQLDGVDRELERSDAGRGLVSGVVQDGTGQAIAGAEVRVFLGTGHALDSATCPVCAVPIFECTDVHTARELVEVVRAGKAQPHLLAATTSGPDGTFVFPDLPLEDLELTARSADRVGRIVYSPGDEATVMIFTQSRLSLRLVKATLDDEAPSIPVAGAHVSAISLDTFRMMETVSDAAGQLRFDGLDEGGGVWVLIEVPGLVPHVGTLYSDQDETELVMSAAQSLVVRTSIAGKPAETTVTVTPSNGQHAITQKTQGASARFDGLGADGYEVTAATDTMIAATQSVGLETALTTVDLELRAAAKLLVTVIDESGEPVPNAEVTAAGRAGDYYTASATDGALVVIGPLGEGTVTIDVITADFRPWHRELDLHPGENTLEVVVKKGVKVRGRVIDSDGNPVTQAEVEARAPVTAPAIAYSEVDGSFELSFDEAGPQELTASLNAVGRTTVKVNAPSDEVVIRLEPRARLKVFAHEGSTPVGGASVTVTPVNGDDTQLNALTGEDGNATVSGLDTGSYRVVVQSAEFRQPPIALVSLTFGRTVSIDVVLDRGLTVSGIVVDARGAPVVRADVSTQPWSSNAVTDEEGKFTLTTLEPTGGYKVEASTELLHSAPLAFKGPQPSLKLVMLPRPMVSGRVFDKATDSPLMRFEVDSRTVEAPDGRFSVPVSGADGDAVVVSISAPGYETHTWEGKGGEIGTVRLEKAKLIEGVVHDARGSPVAGATVTCDYTADEVTSAADGSFRLSLSQYEPGAGLTAQRGQLKGTGVIQLGKLTEIILNPPTRVTGQVVDANGRPVAGLVTVRESNGADELQADAAGDGTFFIDVAQGRWTFITRVSASGQTFIVSGATMRVVLGVPPGSCAVAVQAPSMPDELMLLPGTPAPTADVSFDRLAATEGAVLFGSTDGPRMLRASGFRCGPYTLVARWGGVQRLQQVEVHSGGTNELQLSAPPELAASAPELEAGTPH